MKLVLVLIALFLGNPASYASAPMAVVHVERALSTYELSNLGNFLDDMVTVSIVKKNKIYSRQQAVNVLKSFFSKDKDGKFILEKHGKSVDGQSVFGIGKYITKQKQYTVYFYMKYDANLQDYFMREIKID